MQLFTCYVMVLSLTRMDACLLEDRGLYYDSGGCQRSVPGCSAKLTDDSMVKKWQ